MTDTWPQLAAAELTSKSRHVLVVDDDIDFAEGLAAVLELNGYGVSTAHDIASAEAAVKKHIPDMAVLDICIGTEDGIDLLNRLLTKFPGCPVSWPRPMRNWIRRSGP